MTGAETRYFLDVDIFDYDETVVAHPLMDQIKAAICDRLVRIQVAAGRPISVLDAGTGSGQLARCILGLSGMKLSLCDSDPASRDFCSSHPELADVPFHQFDLTDVQSASSLTERFDVVCVLGVLHHIPPAQRGAFLRNATQIGRTVIVADEGIHEYGSEAERRANAGRWYDFVIAEARRRGLSKLAHLEARFRASDVASIRQPHDDFKESPSAIAEYAQGGGIDVVEIVRIGDWLQWGGGMYLMVLRATPDGDES